MKSLSKELEIGLQIFDSEHLTFSEVVRILHGRISRNEISKAIDRLNDLGMIKEEWVNREGDWRREVLISKEATSFFNDLKNKCIKNTEVKI